MCDECSDISEDNVKLKKHMKDHHEQHICNVCGYIVYDRKKFYEYKRTIRHPATFVRKPCKRKICLTISKSAMICYFNNINTIELYHPV